MKFPLKISVFVEIDGDHQDFSCTDPDEMVSTVDDVLRTLASTMGDDRFRVESVQVELVE